MGVYARNEKGQFAGNQKNDNLTPRTGVPSANPNYYLTPKNVSSANLTPRSVSSANLNYNMTPKTSPLVRPNYNMTPKTTSSVKPNYSLTPKNVDYKKVQQKTSVSTETIDISNDECTDGFDIFGRPNNRKNFFDQDFDSDSSETTVKAPAPVDEPPPPDELPGKKKYIPPYTPNLDKLKQNPSYNTARSAP